MIIGFIARIGRSHSSLATNRAPAPKGQTNMIDRSHFERAHKRGGLRAELHLQLGSKSHLTHLVVADTRHELLQEVVQLAALDIAVAWDRKWVESVFVLFGNSTS